MSLVQALEWRYATKKYDASKQLSEEKFAGLLRTVQLAPSSYGLQPYQFITITDPVKLEQISRAAFGQPQLTTASKIMVVAVETNISEAAVKNYIVRAASLRKMDRKSLESREQFVNTKLNELPAAQKID